MTSAVALVELEVAVLTRPADRRFDTRDFARKNPVLSVMRGETAVEFLLAGGVQSMARIWMSQRSASPRHFHGGHPMGGGLGDSPYPAPPPVPSRDAALDPRPAYFVRVCGFTFEFWSVPQIEVALRFYRERVHPSSRRPICGGHDEMQRWFERVPQHLQANGKRERVVKALETALRQYAQPGTAADPAARRVLVV